MAFTSGSKLPGRSNGRATNRQGRLSKTPQTKKSSFSLLFAWFFLKQKKNPTYQGSSMKNKFRNLRPFFMVAHYLSLSCQQPLDNSCLQTIKPKMRCYHMLSFFLLHFHAFLWMMTPWYHRLHSTDSQTNRFPFFCWMLLNPMGFEGSSNRSVQGQNGLTVSDLAAVCQSVQRQSHISHLLTPVQISLHFHRPLSTLFTIFCYKLLFCFTSIASPLFSPPFPLFHLYILSFFLCFCIISIRPKSLSIWPSLFRSLPYSLRCFLSLSRPLFSDSIVHSPRFGRFWAAHAFENSSKKFGAFLELK